MMEEPTQAHYLVAWEAAQETAPTVYAEEQESLASGFCLGLHQHPSSASPNCQRWVSEVSWPCCQPLVQPFVQVVEDLTVQLNAYVESADAAIVVGVAGVVVVAAAADAVDVVDVVPLDAVDVAAAAVVVAVEDDGQSQNAEPDSYKVST